MKNFLIRFFPDKEQREYNKMRRRHRKELVKLAKETSDFDWEWLHMMVMMRIRHMHEFYAKGNNVWQAEESRLEVIKQLEEVLDLNKQIDAMQDEDLGDRWVQRDDGGVTCEFPDDYGKRVKDFHNREQALYEELYGLIGKNLRWWWD